MQQFTLECKQCGGQIEVDSNKMIASCKFCGSINTVPKSGSIKSNLFNRANYLRRINEFDEAINVYMEILKEDIEESEAYWGIVLCKYGIEYVEDPKTNKCVPTCHRTQFESILLDYNYKQALEYATSETKKVYENEAKSIDKIQKGIIEISTKEEPFDIFICYKESNENGERTEDSVIAQEIYYELEKREYKTFFARKTLENKLGSNYEPIIFSALNSARVMIVMGTKKEYINAVWVKNEWSRFREIIKKGENKVIIPTYKNMSPYELPHEFSNLQALDMNKIGFIQDLCDGINKILKAEEENEPKVIKVKSYSNDIEPLLKRAYLFLEDGDFFSADEYFEKVLDKDPEESRAYIGKLLAELGYSNMNELLSHGIPLEEYNNFNKAVRFSTKKQKNEYMKYNKAILERIEREQREEERQRNKRELEKKIKRKNLFKIIIILIIVSIPIGIGLSINHKIKQEDENKRRINEDKIRTSNTKKIIEERYKEEPDSIVTAEKAIFGLKKDGTVQAVGCLKYDNYKIENEVSSWKDIVQIGASEKYAVGLRKDGTVVATGFSKWDKNDVEEWQDIIAVKGNYNHIAGLKKDGTVVIEGIGVSRSVNVKDWKYIIDIAVGVDCMFGIREDGTVISTSKCNIDHWKDIQSVVLWENKPIGLKKDGTVVTAKDKEHKVEGVEEWKDIVSISVNRLEVVGLKKDGTVVEAHLYGNEKNLEGWKDIISVAVAKDHTVGLKKDGTAVAFGNNSFGQCDVDDWKDIIDIKVTDYSTIGLKKDGTLFVIGDGLKGHLNAANWKDIKIPKNLRRRE